MKSIFSPLLPSLLVLFLLSACSRPGDSLVRQAMTAYQGKDYDRALTLFEQALESDTRYSQALLQSFIANVYAHQEEWEKAAQFQELAMETHGDYRGFVLLGMLQHTAGNDLAAESAYQKAVALQPEKGEAYASLGALYLGQDRASEGAALLEKAAGLEPKLAVIQANLGVAYAMLGNAEKSEAALKKAAALKCENIGQFQARAKKALQEAADKAAAGDRQ